MKKITSLALAKLAANSLWKLKCKHIVVLNIRKLTSISDYFVIGTVESSVQMSAVIDSLKKETRETNIERIYNEPHKNLFISPNWQVLDYGSVVVHVMTQTAREFYSLEKIWNKATKLSFKK